MKISKNYVAGLLENRGGFYLYRGGSKRYQYLGYKIVGIKDDKFIKILIDYFQSKGVNFRQYRVGRSRKVYCLGFKNGLKKFIDFVKKNCYRNDYNKYAYNKNEGWVFVDD